LYGYRFDEKTQRQPMAQFDGWQLSAFRRENGESLWAVPLPAEPLYNGLALAADGTVIVTLRDGALVAVGK
jgi:outer membrane protein assembly factor BamB